KTDQIDKFLRQTVEYKDLLVNDTPLIIDHFYPLKAMAEKVRVEGSFLTEDEFFKMLRTLRTVFSVIQYFEQRAGRYAYLEMLFEHLPLEKSLLKSIDSILDNQGRIKENATPRLWEITKDILKKEQE